MHVSIFHKAVLGIAGLTALVIGGSLLASPMAFYSGYGIALPSDISLTNELRASGGSIVMLGLLILGGLALPRFATASTLLAAAMFLAYGAARLTSIGIDGQPSTGMVTAMAAELFIGAASLFALIAARKSA
ncbi:DUF4345 domain-containing protein [Hoeflea sp.]|uniref:DUF4345 domain-containing protein n=1 Tax=Hoeflea sp. TaxID=1940281 RepID=UPI003B525F88